MSAFKEGMGAALVIAFSGLQPKFDIREGMGSGRALYAYGVDDGG